MAIFLGIVRFYIIVPTSSMGIPNIPTNMPSAVTEGIKLPRPPPKIAP